MLPVNTQGRKLQEQHQEELKSIAMRDLNPRVHQGDQLVQAGHHQLRPVPTKEDPAAVVAAVR